MTRQVRSYDVTIGKCVHSSEVRSQSPHYNEFKYMAWQHACDEISQGQTAERGYSEISKEMSSLYFGLDVFCKFEVRVPETIVIDVLWVKVATKVGIFRVKRINLIPTFPQILSS